MAANGGPTESFAPGAASLSPVAIPAWKSGGFSSVETDGWRLSEMALVGDVAEQARAIVDEAAPFKNNVLNGNSGAGLSTLMKAMAGELHARGVPTLFARGADLAGRVHELFDQARNQNAVVFIDGLDAAAPIRKPDNADPTLLQLVSQLERGDVRVIAATSRTDMVDAEAMTHLKGLLTVPNPRNEMERRGIIDVLVRRRKLEVSEEGLSDMARATRGRSPSDLSEILDIAQSHAGGKKLSDADLMEARLTKAAGPPEPLPSDARFFKLSVAHEMGHVVTRHLFQQMARSSANIDEMPQAVDLVSFHPRGGAQAFVNLMFGGNSAKTFEYYFAEMASDYGGRAAEYFFGKGHLSAGPGGDLNHAESLATEAVSKGMGAESGIEINSAQVAQDVSRLKKATEKAAYSVVAFYGDFIKDFANEMLERRQGGQELNLTGRELTRRLSAWESERAVPLAVLMSEMRSLRDELRPAAPKVFDPVTRQMVDASTVAEKLAF
ncbi:AAA family ATPase [bacterium CPR1]|nr:AAA family ATPase [bacterium CPR1]